MWLMAYVTHFGIYPNLLMKKPFKVEIWEQLRRYYAAMPQLDTCQQIEQFFQVRFCAIKYKGKRGFSPDDFYYISRRTAYYEIESSNIWFYWINARSDLLPTLAKKLKKDIRRPQDYRCAIPLSLFSKFLKL